jgi:hypothetical protein
MTRYYSDSDAGKSTLLRCSRADCTEQAASHRRHSALAGSAPSDFVVSELWATWTKTATSRR